MRFELTGCDWSVCQNLNIWDVMTGIKSIYVNSLTCVRVKGSESDCFRIDRCVRQECIMSPWPFNLYMNGVIKEVKMGTGRRREWRPPAIFYRDDLVLCGKFEKDL